MAPSVPYFRPATDAQGLANYPHARIVNHGQGHYIYVSGTSSRRGDGSFVGAARSEKGDLTLNIGEQSAAVLDNIRKIIEEASAGQAGMHNVIDATVFLVDMRKDYKDMNEEWNLIWPDRQTAPARTTVEVRALPREEILVEIKCTAYYESTQT